MAKVAIKSEKLSPLEGIFSIMEQFDSNSRCHQVVRDVFLVLFGGLGDYAHFCGLKFIPLFL